MWEGLVFLPENKACKTKIIKGHVISARACLHKDRKQELEVSRNTMPEKYFVSQDLQSREQAPNSNHETL